ncbi:sensor histidine kinase [Brevundimonas sp. SL130]|uniref:sensor histidine kinase n=1 Tax=Brevundimonas sp. SL130 TaxID=2995143 RepID=UPI00226CE2D7|nr:ATP-binding protein [Brevundimonas sp. SL130]WAC59602.1 ATP-binding protein [Brevundimonas sp. SL130]
MEPFAQSILMDAPMAIVAVDRSGHVRCANATAERFFGRCLIAPPADISDLIDDFDTAVLNSPSAVKDINALSRSSGKDLYRRARRFDGRQAFVDLQAAPFSKAGENLVTLFILDMTASVEAETALQDVKLQIIHNWRLNSLGEVASMLAHELNQPLGAAVNYLAAAESAFRRRGVDASETADMMSSAKGQIERATDIIRRFRSLLAHDTGFQTRENVAAVIDEIMPILHVHARETEAELAVWIDPADFTRCDRVQLQQVILNLARNAMDAPRVGTPRKVEISGRQTPDGYLMVVSDNGPGVAAEMVDRLFDPLVSSKPGGMGLGLSICRTIVEAHGGAIELGSSPQGGAAFAFTLNANVHDFHRPSGTDDTNAAPDDYSQDAVTPNARRA